MKRSTDMTLLGSYRTPVFTYGAVVVCEMRGQVELVGLSSGPIPWPIGKRGRNKAIALYGDLAEAVRRESAAAVGHWWGVGAETVWRWRKALGVSPTTEGTSRLRANSPHLEALREAARPALSDPARAEKIRQAKLGKSRPPESSRASGRAHLGKKASKKTRRLMSAAQRARGAGGADTGRPWTKEEDEAVRKLTPQDAARATGRTLKAIWERRKKLRVNPAG